MAEKEVLFSGAFRGYNRRDVNEYIVSENKKFSEIEAGLKEEIEKLKQELVKKEDELTSVRSQLDGLESVISSRSRSQGMDRFPKNPGKNPSVI